MNRRDFISAAAAATLAGVVPSAAALPTMLPAPIKPMDVGLLIAPFSAPEEHFRRVRELGFDN